MCVQAAACARVSKNLAVCLCPLRRITARHLPLIWVMDATTHFRLTRYSLQKVEKVGAQWSLALVLH